MLEFGMDRVEVLLIAVPPRWDNSEPLENVRLVGCLHRALSIVDLKPKGEENWEVPLSDWRRGMAPGSACCWDLPCESWLLFSITLIASILVPQARRYLCVLLITDVSSALIAKEIMVCSPYDVKRWQHSSPVRQHALCFILSQS
jgi:hypothetical protein